MENVEWVRTTYERKIYFKWFCNVDIVINRKEKFSSIKNGIPLVNIL